MQAWLSYIKLELRANEIVRARAIYERYIACHPSQQGYIKYAKWEDRNGQKALCRRIYERACEELRLDEQDEKLFLAFARFEERCGEMDRAKAIFRYGLERLPKRASEELYKAYTAFEKSYGDRQGVEEVVTTKRRHGYEEAVASQPRDYDSWFDYAKLEEGEGNIARVREVYERAIANPPPPISVVDGVAVHDKRLWRRYIHLWIRYALLEELDAKDIGRARAVYAACLKLIPHKQFSFSKIWLMAAQLEIRAKDVGAARKLLGMAIGICPKEKTIKGYIALELALGEIDRVRKLYERYLTLFPTVVSAWIAFANLERSLGEDERAEAIFELAVTQPVVDMPEVAWKAYIDAMIESGKLDAARALYERLLHKTSHVKVFMSFATFEASVACDAAAARRVYARGYKLLKETCNSGNGLTSVVPSDVEVREQRSLLLDAWRGFETNLVQEAREAGRDAEAEAALTQLRDLEAKLPQKVKKKRAIFAGGVRGPVPSAASANGDEAAVSALGDALAFEEYWDYVFPDDAAQQGSGALKLLALAQKWKAAGGKVAMPSAAAAPEPLDDGSSAAAASGFLAAAIGGGSFGEGEGEGEGHHAGHSAGPAFDPSEIDLDDLDGDSGSTPAHHHQNEQHSLAGHKRSRPADFEAGDGDGDGGDSGGLAPPARRRALNLPSARSGAPSDISDPDFRAHVAHMPQSSLLERDEGEGDVGHGREVEREIEDEVHRAVREDRIDPFHSKDQRSELPRDFYTEADAGGAADRDI